MMVSLTESGFRPLQASSEDDHGPLCGDRRVFGSIERLRRGRRREDRAGGEDRQRAGGADRLVRRARARSGADRPGGRAVVAMALRGDEAGGLGGGAAGDAACAHGAADDAGQDRPQRRARHRATDAARLVPSGALQIDGGAGDAGAADGAQAGSIEALRHRDEPARDIARFRAEGGADDAKALRAADRGARRRPCDAGGHREGAAFGACGFAARVRHVRETGAGDGAAGQARAG